MILGKKKDLLLFFLLFILFLQPVFAISYVDLDRTVIGELPSDWLGTWNYRIELTVNSSDIDEPLSDFPILVSLSNSTGENSDNVTCIFDEVGNNYNSTAYTDSDKITQLYFEIENWNLTTKEAWIWVKIPSISDSSDKKLYLYYDSTKDGSAYHIPKNVWDQNFVLVNHMKDDPDSSHIIDSTINDNDGTKKDANEPIEATGIIGKAQKFDGSDDKITITTAPSIQDFSAITLLVWFNTPVTGATREAMDFGYWLNPYGFLHQTPSTAKHNWFLKNITGSASVSGEYFANNTWEFHGFVWNGSTWWTIDNGALGNEKSFIGTLACSAYNPTLGSRFTGTNPYDGFIDELQISNISRSSAWIKASYETQRNHFLRFSSEQNLQYPSTILITELESNYEVKLYNNTNSLISNGTANSEGQAILTLPESYRSSSFEGSYRIYDNNGTFIYSKWFEDIKGGDQLEVISEETTLGLAIIGLVLALFALILALSKFG